jgi:hypothetical protein
MSESNGPKTVKLKSRSLCPPNERLLNEALTLFPEGEFDYWPGGGEGEAWRPGPGYELKNGVLTKIDVTGDRTPDVDCKGVLNSASLSLSLNPDLKENWCRGDIENGTSLVNARPMFWFTWP